MNETAYGALIHLGLKLLAGATVTINYTVLATSGNPYLGGFFVGIVNLPGATLDIDVQPNYDTSNTGYVVFTVPTDGCYNLEIDPFYDYYDPEDPTTYYTTGIASSGTVEISEGGLDCPYLEIIYPQETSCGGGPPPG